MLLEAKSCREDGQCIVTHYCVVSLCDDKAVLSVSILLQYRVGSALMILTALYMHSIRSILCSVCQMRHCSALGAWAHLSPRGALRASVMLGTALYLSTVLWRARYLSEVAQTSNPATLAGQMKMQSCGSRGRLPADQSARSTAF